MKFEILQRAVRYQGRAFNVEDVTVRLPDGGQAVYNLVEHTGSVSIVPLDDEGNLLFVRQFRLGVMDELLELPAGTKPAGEDPLDCASREVREETGMAAGEMILLGDFYLAPGYSSERMFVYLARDLRYDPLEHDADEFLQLVKIPVAEAYALALRGELRDSKSLASLLLALPLLKAGL